MKNKAILGVLIWEKFQPDCWDLFLKLRRRGFPLSPEDYQAVQDALCTGFGCDSRIALRNLCCALWAKSMRDKQIITALFNQLDVPKWDLAQGGNVYEGERGADEVPGIPEGSDQDKSEDSEMSTLKFSGLPPIWKEYLKNVSFSEFSFVSQYGLSYREAAQAWRRLRRPVREGPLVELDVDATVDRRCRAGIVTAPVLIPRRRNTASLLILVDRLGSMTPFHGFVREICDAIEQSGNLESFALYYFHNLPAEGADRSVLESVKHEAFPTLETVLPDIQPLFRGFVYEDPELLQPLPVGDILESHQGGAVAIFSDAGAARGQYNTLRLLDTLAFLKALRTRIPQVVWLNPLPRDPRDYWQKTTAEQIARHVPMFPMDREGMYGAVNELRRERSQ